MNPRDTFTAMKYRLAFLCTLHGSTNETPEGVPADQRAAFDEHVEYHNQQRAKIFDEICRDFGAIYFEDIPPDSQAKALRELEFQAAVFTNASLYELRIQRIEQTEALERTFDESIA